MDRVSWRDAVRPWSPSWKVVVAGPHLTPGLERGAAEVDACVGGGDVLGGGRAAGSRGLGAAPTAKGEDEAGGNKGARGAGAAAGGAPEAEKFAKRWGQGSTPPATGAVA